MRIFVAVDMEGISGITLAEQVRRTEPQYQAGRRYMTWDANACAEGCFNAGADEVVIWDAHGGGFNMVWDEIHARAQLRQGRRDAGRMADIGEFDALILLGYHAMAGTETAILEHTMSSASWQNFWINGRKAGELAIDAGIAGDAGDAGVPCIMASGDDKLCAEAAEWIPGIHTAQVKQALSCFGAQFLSKEDAHRLIAETAEKACRDLENVKPLVHDKPVTMRLERVERGTPPSESPDRPWLKRIDSRTYEVTADDTRHALSRL